MKHRIDTAADKLKRNVERLEALTRADKKPLWASLDNDDTEIGQELSSRKEKP